MKMYVLITLLLCSSFNFAQQNNKKPSKEAISIDNCDLITADDIIVSSLVTGAIAYHFNVHNQTTGNQLTLVSSTNSISLLAFVSILTYNSQFTVRVKAELPDGSLTLWSKKCKFKIGKEPKSISLAGIKCGSTITNLNTPIYSTAIYTADCYTFYVQNITTGQSGNTACTANNFFTLSSLGMTFTAGDIITVQVTYTIGELESKITAPCKFIIKVPKEIPFCETFTYSPTSDGIPDFNQKTVINGFVGNNFFLWYEDGGTFPGTYPTPVFFEPDAAEIFAVASEVLSDLDDFLFKNDAVDPSCNAPNTRMWVKISPYTNQMITDGVAVNALAFAGQAVSENELDVNYLSQGCAYTPNVQLYMNHGGYGDDHVEIGWILLNPNLVPTPPYNYQTVLTSFTGEYDFYTVILHEMIHILGFTNEDFKFQEFLRAYHLGSDEKLYNDGILNCGEGPNFSALNNITCTNIHYDGYLLNDQPVSAPAIFEVGTSLSHFPDNCGLLTNSYVMNPSLADNDASKRCISQTEAFALQDLGYNLNSPYGINNSNLNCPIIDNSGNSDYIIGVHDGLDVNGFKDDEGFGCYDFTYSQISQCFDLPWPLVLRPLDNDINADFISEAIVITGAANASVSITTINELEFTPTQPGLYTISYIPGRYKLNTTDIERIGLPTYIQVWVPNCSSITPSNLLCNTDPECNQICFDGDVYDHTLLRGSGITSNNFSPDYTPFNNGFRIKSSSAENDNTNILQPCYSSVFFWVDTDINQEYSISFERKFQKTTALPSPDFDFYIYLGKSSDMITGQVNQSGNNFPSIPSSSQLIYQETFSALLNDWESASFCFTATDDYDMIFFYSEQLPPLNSVLGTTSIRSLEFMEKEFVEDLLVMDGCIPQNLSMGLPFCALTTNEFEWIENSSNAVVSNTQFYDAGNIISDLIDDYIFTMSYPPLPITTVIPTENSSCSESYTVAVSYVDCCPPGNSITHPLTCYATSRTFGDDIESVGNALYYSGSYHDVYGDGITFGLQTEFSLTGPQQHGFLLKIENNCVDWLVTKENQLDNQLETDNFGNLYYCSRNSYSSNEELAKINLLDGTNIWNVPITGIGNFSTDFAIDNINQRIYITGHAESSYIWSGNVIHNGIGSVSFILAVDFNGNYLGSNTFSPTFAFSGNKFTYSFVSVDESTGTIYHVYRDELESWLWQTLDLSLLPTGFSNTITAIDNISTTTNTPNFVVTGIEYDPVSSTLFSQIVYVENLIGTSSGIPFAPTTEISLIQSNLDLSVNNEIAILNETISPSTQINTDLFYFSFNRPDINVNGGDIYQTYTITDLLGVSTLTDKSNSSVSFSPNWSNPSTIVPPVDGSILSKGIKNTPLGTYSTGSFSDDFQTGIFTLSPNVTPPPGSGQAMSFFGIKYDNAGNITAMILPDDNTNTTSNGGTKSQTEVVESGSELFSEDVKLYPNPGKDQFTLEVSGEFTIIVRSVHGQEVLRSKGFDMLNFNLSGFSRGIYLVQIQNESGNRMIKLIKE
jgi:Secretion system C-terminal sorting domain